jgi:hypothetical protein
LEPDHRYKRAYLEATVAAVSGRSFVFKDDHALEEAAICSYDRSEPRTIAQQMLDRHWNSTSWQMTSPLRTLARHLQGLPKETRPMVHSEAEAEQLIDTMHRSLSWKLTAPMRWGGRFFHRPSEGN